jgi:hypothetical protein
MVCFLHFISCVYFVLFLLTQSGCKGTTRLPGAGNIVKEEGKYFGRNPALAREAPPLERLEQEAEARANSKSFRYEDRTKPQVPDKRERPVMGIKTSKNFITANAVEAILQVPKATENGELNYMKKEDFGKVPSYLIEVKEEIRRENDMIDKYVKEQMGHVEEEPDRYEEVSHSERQALIDALKAKWDKVNAAYQKITHLTQLDTAGQVRRKEHFESTMSALEQDIEKLSRPGPLLMKV